MAKVAPPTRRTFQPALAGGGDAAAPGSAGRFVSVIVSFPSFDLSPQSRPMRLLCRGDRTHLDRIAFQRAGDLDLSARERLGLVLVAQLVDFAVNRIGQHVLRSAFHALLGASLVAARHHVLQAAHTVADVAHKGLGSGAAFFARYSGGQPQARRQHEPYYEKTLFPHAIPQNEI